MDSSTSTWFLFMRYKLLLEQRKTTILYILTWFHDDDGASGSLSAVRNENIIDIPRPERWLSDYDNHNFFKLFRMEKSTFHLLLKVIGEMDTGEVLQKKYTGGYKPIELKYQILIFVWYMATQDSLIYIADRFTISATTAMKIVNTVLYFVVKLKKEYIQFPKTIEDLEIVSRGFPSYPGVVGALDGTHIFVKVSKDQQDSYIDRYRRHSINVMAICDSKALFTYAFIGFPGSAHDSRVLQQSEFFNHIQRYGPNSLFKNSEKYHLVGDSAFGLKSWLMTPYRDHQNISRIQKHHNYCLSSARVVIEHAFGLLKGRWRRLIYINTYNICKTIEIATAALVLHNFCIILKYDLWSVENLPREIDLNNIHPIAEVEEAGREKRDLIARNLSS